MINLRGVSTKLNWRLVCRLATSCEILHVQCCVVLAYVLCSASKIILVLKSRTFRKAGSIRTTLCLSTYRMNFINEIIKTTTTNKKRFFCTDITSDTNQFTGGCLRAFNLPRGQTYISAAILARVSHVKIVKRTWRAKKGFNNTSLTIALPSSVFLTKTLKYDTLKFGVSPLK